jgi:bifunctional DNase/RNase
VYYARLVVDVDGSEVELDARPSDAIAISVRAGAPIFVSEYVMEHSGFEPEEGIDIDGDIDGLSDLTSIIRDHDEEIEEVDETRLSAFADFVNSLDLDDLEDSDE